MNLEILCLFLSLFVLSQVDGHGRLIDPPARSTAWRYGFKTPVDYNDNQLYCGGLTVQWKKNGGKCGICGDSWSGPRDHELPDGKFTKNLQITRTYHQGDTITAKVELTTNHKGFFKFRICPATTDKKEVTQECLDKYLLDVVGSNDKKYIVPNDKAGIFSSQLRLPKSLTCNRCVVQWTYTAGNTWGKCPDGSMKTGCGPQETFMGCADVKILGKSVVNKKFDPKTILSKTSIPTSTKISTSTKIPTSTISFGTSTPKVEFEVEQEVGSIDKVCNAVGVWKIIDNMDAWCQQNCVAGFCPSTHCDCINLI